MKKVKKVTRGTLRISSFTFAKDVEAEVSDELAAYIDDTFKHHFEVKEGVKEATHTSKEVSTGATPTEKEVVRKRRTTTTRRKKVGTK